jgi:hypothetical protein
MVRRFISARWKATRDRAISHPLINALILSLARSVWTGEFRQPQMRLWQAMAFAKVVEQQYSQGLARYSGLSQRRQIGRTASGESPRYHPRARFCF